MLLVGNIVSPKGLAYMCVYIDILYYTDNTQINSLLYYKSYPYTHSFSKGLTVQQMETITEKNL